MVFASACVTVSKQFVARSSLMAGAVTTENCQRTCESAAMRHLARRHLLAIVMAVAMVAAGAGTAGASVGGFDDVGGGDFFAKPVQWMADEGITTGTGPCAFSPRDTLTRGEGATFVWRAEGARNATAFHPFSDVSAGWQHEPVSWLYQKGYVTGVSASRFAPDAFMTRAQFAVLLWRVAGEPTVSQPVPFDDVTASWQTEAVAWMAKKGITTGTSPNRFSPDLPLTRA